MDLAKQIIDQRINKILEENTAFFSDKDMEKNRSRAFLLLGVSAYLDIDIAEAMQYLTDGGYDGGFDAAYIVEAQDSQLNVVLFQSKYSRKLEVDSHFPLWFRGTLRKWKQAMQERISVVNSLRGIPACRFLQSDEILCHFSGGEAVQAPFDAMDKDVDDKDAQPQHRHNVSAFRVNGGVGKGHGQNNGFDQDKMQYFAEQKCFQAEFMPGIQYHPGNRAAGSVNQR